MAAFNKSKCEYIRDDLEKLLESLGKKHGMTIKLGKMTYSNEIIKSGLTMTLNDESGEYVAEEELSWASHHSKFGLPEDGLDKIIRVNKKPFQIIGLNPRAPKNAVCLIDMNGKRFKCSPEMAITALGESS